MSVYHIELFGRVRVWEGEKLLLENFRTRHSALIFAYLACNTGNFVSRKELGILLWQEMPEMIRNSRLSYEILSLVKTIKQAGIEENIIIDSQGKNFLRLSDKFVCDVCLFESLGQESLKIDSTEQRLAALEKAISLYKAEFMREHCEPWAVAQRERFSQLYRVFLTQMKEDMEVESQIEKLYWERMFPC